MCGTVRASPDLNQLTTKKINLFRAIFWVVLPGAPELAQASSANCREPRAGSAGEPGLSSWWPHPGLRPAAASGQTLGLHYQVSTCSTSANVPNKPPGQAPRHRGSNLAPASPRQPFPAHHGCSGWGFSRGRFCVSPSVLVLVSAAPRPFLKLRNVLPCPTL